MKNHMVQLAAFSIMLATGTAAAAAKGQAGCDVQVLELGEAKINGYNALSGGEYSEPIRLRISNRGETACSGTLSLTGLFGSSRLEGPHSNSLAYAIYGEGNSSQMLFDPSTQRSQAIPLTVPAGEVVDLRPRLVVPGGQAGRAGRYAASIDAQFHDSSGKLIETRSFTVSTQITPSAQANFVGYGRDATLDLGELSPGVTGSVGLQIRASADVDVEVSSESGGALVHPSGAEVPYQLSINGQTVRLGSPQTVEIPLPNPVEGRNNPVVVTVGQFSDAPVGDYRDVVTFRISAR